MSTSETTASSSASSASSTPSTLPVPTSEPEPPSYNYCDICWGSPNWQGMTFQRCKICKVGVHNTCYGISGYEKHITDPNNPNFICWACKSIGKTIKTRSYDGNGIRRCIQIHKRPTECCLCSVNDKDIWYHAMHPIYDHEGVHGRQIVLPPTKDYPQYRLAWAHTLCAYTIYIHPNTAGTVFACDANGKIDTEENDDDDDVDNDNDVELDNDDNDNDVELDNDDDYSINTELKHNDTSIDVSTHHYGYVLPDKDGTLNTWAQCIKEHQTSLKCIICKKRDDVPSSFRIPINCNANEQYEQIDLRKVHKKTMMKSKTCCIKAIHVGCAALHRDINRRLVYIFPGIVNDDTGEARNPAANIFCTKHAIDLDNEKVPGYNNFHRPTKYNNNNNNNKYYYYQKESQQQQSKQEDNVVKQVDVKQVDAKQEDVKQEEPKQEETEQRKWKKDNRSRSSELSNSTKKKTKVEY